MGLAIHISLAQRKKVDSLRTVLANHPQADTFRVNRLNELAEALERSGWGKAFDSLLNVRSDSVINHTLSLATQLQYTYGLAKALYNKAHPYSNSYATGQTKRQVALLNQALPLAQRVQAKKLQLDILGFLGNALQDSSRAQGRRYLQRGLALARAWHFLPQVVEFLDAIGHSYEYDYQFADELKWYFQALKLARQIGNKPQQAHLLESISDKFSALTDYEQALSYARQYQQIALQTRNHWLQLEALFLVGNCYRFMGRHALAIAQYEQLLGDSTVSPSQQIYSLRHIGYSHEQLGDWSAAIRYTYQSLALAAKYHVYAYPYNHYLVLARAYQRANQPDSALYYGLKTLPLARRYEAKVIIEQASLVLAQVYAQRHDYANAYRYEQQYIDLKDSLVNVDLARKATALHFTDRMNQQQSQIALLSKDKQLQAEEVRHQRQLLYSSLLVLGLVGGLLTLVYYNNRQKQKANRLLEQQKREIQHQQDQTQQALTELKATQAQLIHREKMASLGELTAGIAHEIQNPLNFVNNFSELSTELVDELEEEHQKPQPDMNLNSELLIDLKDNLTKILHHGKRASSIVKGMLEHARSTGSEIRLVALNELVAEYWRLAYHGQRTKDKEFNCELRTTFDSAVGEVALMPEAVGRVLLNLFSNAFYAIRQRQQQRAETTYRPTIHVETKRGKEAIIIRVTDNGVGIPEAVKAKIFQPFFTTKPTGEGTGLGLSLSYDIITKLHRGSLSVTSQLGEGTQFTLSLPAALMTV